MIACDYRPALVSTSIPEAKPCGGYAVCVLTVSITGMTVAIRLCEKHQARVADKDRGLLSPITSPRRGDA